MKAVAVTPGKRNSIHLDEIPQPALAASRASRL
jgi:hypothetical protein